MTTLPDFVYDPAGMPVLRAKLGRLPESLAFPHFELDGYFVLCRLQAACRAGRAPGGIDRKQALVLRQPDLGQVRR